MWTEDEITCRFSAPECESLYIKIYRLASGTMDFYQEPRIFTEFQQYTKRFMNIAPMNLNSTFLKGFYINFGKQVEIMLRR